MDICTKDIVKEAIQLSGRTDIHIDDYPMPIGSRDSDGYDKHRDQLIDRYYSIYVDYDCDCSDFWDTYDNLKNSVYWKTYLKLVDYRY